MEDIESIVVDLYKSGHSMIQIAEDLFGFKSTDRVRSILGKHPESGFNPRPNLKRRGGNKYEYDRRFFEHINSEEKAYFFGFLAADGWLKLSGGMENSPLGVMIELSVVDIEILERFSIALGKNAPKPTIYKARSGFGRRSETTRLSLFSVEMCLDLMNKGFNKDKTHHLSGISKHVPLDLMNHFVRGYIDGDGGPCVEKTGRLRFSVRGTTDFLKELQSLIPATTRITTTQKWQNLYTSSKVETVKMYEWMYKDSNVFLKRKFDKCNSALAR